MQRIGTLDVKLNNIRQAVACQTSFTVGLLDPSMTDWREECIEKMQRTREEARVLEQAIQGKAAQMQSAGWLKSAHEEERKKALEAVKMLEPGTADHGTQNMVAEEQQDLCNGPDEEILVARQKIERLDEKICRLRERCEATFMSEETRTAIVNEIQKTAALKDKLEENLNYHAEQRRRVLPARPSSSWINLQLLKRQHARLLQGVPLDKYVQNMKQQAQAEHQRTEARETRARQLRADHAVQESMLIQEKERHDNCVHAMQEQRSKLSEMVERLRALTEQSDMADTYQAKINEIEEILVRVW